MWLCSSVDLWYLIMFVHSLSYLHISRLVLAMGSSLGYLFKLLSPSYVNIFHVSQVFFSIDSGSWSIFLKRRLVCTNTLSANVYQSNSPTILQCKLGLYYRAEYVPRFQSTCWIINKEHGITIVLYVDLNTIITILSLFHLTLFTSVFKSFCKQYSRVHFIYHWYHCS